MRVAERVFLGPSLSPKVSKNAMPSMHLSQHPNKQEVANFLRQHVNWNHFFSLVRAIGDSLNDRKGRFIKSDLLEMAVEAYGSERIKWVDQEGWDHEIDQRLKVEMKHQATSLFTKGGKPKSHVGVIRMQNTLGGKVRTLHRTFSFLLITDLQSAAVVDFTTVAKAVVAKKDVIQIGSNRLTIADVAFIVQPSDVDVRGIEMPPLRDAIREQCSRYVAEVRRRYPQRPLRHPRSRPH
jgi:hypothetical protein